MKLEKTISQYWQPSDTFNYAVSKKSLVKKLLSEIPENEAYYSLKENNEVIGYLYVYQKSIASTFINFYPEECDEKQLSSMLHFIMDYLFNSINTLKICCDVINSNDEILNFYMKHGFEIEGKFKNQLQVESKFLDVSRLSCFKDNYCKFLNKYLTKLRKGHNFRLNIGDEFTEEIVISNESIVQFAKLSGDDNPLHIDKGFAIKQGFQSNIVHGILSASIFSKILGTNFPGNGSIYVSQDLNFLKPIYAGDTIVVKLKILSIIGSKFTLSTQLYTSDIMVLQGTAKVIKFTN